MNLYFISGLGVDKRVFQRLCLSPEFSIKHIEWIRPLPRETISEYSKRLSLAIDQTKPFALIGLSFGGMIVTEMNQYVKPVKTIIISSVPTYLQLPWYIRSIRFFPLYKIIPGRVIKKPNPIFYKLFGIATEQEKKVIKEVLKDADPVLLKWSIHAIIGWHNKVIPENLIHIHGKEDKVLPIKFTKANLAIEGGEHFMVYSKADQISVILNALLKPNRLIV